MLLGMDADVIAMDVGGDLFRFGGIENEADTLLEFGEEAVRGPAMLQEQEFQAGAFAIFTEYVRFAEDFGDAAGEGLPDRGGAAFWRAGAVGGETAANARDPVSIPPTRLRVWE